MSRQNQSKTKNGSADSASRARESGHHSAKPLSSMTTQVLPRAAEKEGQVVQIKKWLSKGCKSVMALVPQWLKTAELSAAVASSESTEESSSSSSVAKYYQENPIDNIQEPGQKPSEESGEGRFPASALPDKVSQTTMSDQNSVSTSEFPDLTTASAASAEAVTSSDAVGPAEPLDILEKPDNGLEPETFEEAIRRLEKSASPVAPVSPPEIATAPHLSLSEGSGTHFSYRLFAMEGSLNHDYQDAARANPDSGFAAIADGTTLGGFSEIVSNELVTRFVRDSRDLDQEAERAAWWLETRKAWYAQFRALFNDASAAEQSRWDKGGSATFLGMRIEGGGTYHLHMVGDCSLLWLDGSLKTLLRIDGATHFNSHPAVLHTEQSETPEELIAGRVTGKALPGSMALLVTDALAKFLQETEPWRNDPEFGVRLRTAEKETLRDWLLPEKEAFRLDADDYTFLLLQFPYDEAWTGKESGSR